MVERLRVLGGSVVVPLLALATAAMGERVQFPTRLPVSTAARATPQPEAEPASDPAPEPEQESEAPAATEHAQHYPPLTVAPPEVLAPDAYLPTTTVAPYFPEPVCPDYRWQFYGDFLWLQARSAELTYAVASDGPFLPVALVDPDMEPGFRVGLGRTLVNPIRLGAAYTHLESSTSHALSVNAPGEILPLVLYPGTAPDPDFLRGRASYGIDFDLIDADYRASFLCDENYTLDYVLGARYADLQQDFRALFSNQSVERVATRIEFEGAGIRLAGEGERRSSSLAGALVYGRASASLLAGKFRGHYLQSTDGVGTIVDTGWKADRVVPILELELGVGWTGPADHFRVTAGYMFSAWCNTVQTDEFIQAVQSANFVDLGDTLSFDGFVGRAELRF